MFDSGFAPPLGAEPPREDAPPEQLKLFRAPEGVPPRDLTALRDSAAIIDWKSDARYVLAALDEAATAWGLVELWSEEEAVAWGKAELYTWQLVDELVTRFEARGLLAFDTESNSDTYGTLFTRAEHGERATELITASDRAGALRPFQRRRFE